MKRRNFIGLSSTIGLMAGILPTAAIAEIKQVEQKGKRYQNGASPWPICLDTATIRPASLKEKVSIAAEAGLLRNHLSRAPCHYGRLLRLDS